MFHANWKEYLIDALELYIANEGLVGNPRRLAKKDYKKLTKDIELLIAKAKGGDYE